MERRGTRDGISAAPTLMSLADVEGEQPGQAEASCNSPVSVTGETITYLFLGDSCQG